jgi:two-component system response regulator YesN
VEKARDLLIGSSMSVADIATHIGYNNITYFNWIFKKTTGQSPTEYRSGEE